MRVKRSALSDANASFYNRFKAMKRESEASSKGNGKKQAVTDTNVPTTVQPTTDTGRTSIAKPDLKPDPRMCRTLGPGRENQRDAKQDALKKVSSMLHSITIGRGLNDTTMNAAAHEH